MNVSFELRGFGFAQRQFAEVIGQVAEGLSEVGREAALLIQDHTLPHIPVDTGLTRSAFADHEAVGQGPDGQWQFGLRTPRLRRKGYRARWIEFGTKGGQVRFRARVPAQRARPFLRPAAAAARMRIEARWREAIQSAIKRQASGFAHERWFSALEGSAADWQRKALAQNIREGLGRQGGE